MRRFLLAGVILTWAVFDAGAAEKQFIRIVSPANGAVVRPGRTLMVKVTGAGEYQVLGAIGPVGFGEVDAPLGRPPWIVPVKVPLDTDLGKTYFTVVASTRSGVEVDSQMIEVDVEPAEIPPVEFDPFPVILTVGGCRGLTSESFCGLPVEVYGKYPDGTVVAMNDSTRITFVSEAPSIARLSRDGRSLFGMSPGTTKLVVFGKYSVDVKVFR